MSSSVINLLKIKIVVVFSFFMMSVITAHAQKKHSVIVKVNQSAECGKILNRKVHHAALRIFPIPVKNNLNIESTEMITSIKLFDAEGQQINAYAIFSNIATLSTVNFKPGLYLIEVSTTSKVTRHKVVINSQ